MKFRCSICILINSENLISRSVSEGPFDFEITRVDCIKIYCTNDINLRNLNLYLHVKIKFSFVISLQLNMNIGACFIKLIEKYESYRYLKFSH